MPKEKIVWQMVFGIDVYGSIDIQAETLEDARKKFEKITAEDLLENPDTLHTQKVRYLGGCKKNKN